MTNALLDALAAQPEYGPTLRRLICELAIAGRLIPRMGSWAEHRLDKIVSVRGGSTPSMARPEYWGGDIPWVSPKDMHAGDIVTSEMFVTREALAKTNLELVPLGSVLIVGRSGILKRKLPAQVTRVPCTVNQDIKALTPSALIDSAYLRLWLLGSERQILAEDVKTGTTVQSLVFPRLFARRVLLPPIPEQHRIVAKVDELMALCDRLEARQQDAEAAHARLVQALLDSLTQARDAEEFQACWRRLMTAFAEAFTSETSVDALSQTVRTLAFRGALSRDGTADWRHVRVNEAVQFLNGYAFKSEWFVPHGVRLVRNVNIAHGTIDWRDAACIPAERSDEFAAFALNEGDVLLTLDRPIISTGLKVAVVRAGDLPCLLLQRVARLTPMEHQIRAAFLLHWLRSPLFIDAIDPGRSNGVPHISTKQVGSMMIPLPALDEQDRIVANLDNVLALCDQLKARITAARAKHTQLAEALVAQAVAA